MSQSLRELQDLFKLYHLQNLNYIKGSLNTAIVLKQVNEEAWKHTTYVIQR